MCKHLSLLLNNINYKRFWIFYKSKILKILYNIYFKNNNITCIDCKTNSKISLSLEDYEYKLQQKFKKHEKYNEGYEICLECNHILCSYHLYSHSHSIIINTKHIYIHCIKCNIEISLMNNSNLSNIENEFISILSSSLFHFNLLLQFPLKNQKCLYCNNIIYKSFKCTECSYILCKNCYNNINILFNHKHNNFYIEYYPNWILSMLFYNETTIGSFMNMLLLIPNRPAIGEIKQDNSIYWYTFNEFKCDIISLGNNLLNWLNSMNFNDIQQENILISTLLSYNSLVFDYTCLFYGFIPIRVHFNNIHNIKDILINNNISIIVLEYINLSILSLLQSTNIKYIIIFNDNINNINADLSLYNIISLSKLLKKNNSCDNYPFYKHNKNDIFMKLCSSGSTGNPKLFSINEYDILGQMKRSKYGNNEYPNVTAIWNISHRINSIFHLYTGGRILLCSIDNTKLSLFSQIKLCKPTFLVATPIFWNKLYQLYRNNCIYYQIHNPDNSFNSIQQKQIKYIKSLFGKRLSHITTGGSQISQIVLNFLKKCFPIVINRYGTTETGAIASNGKLLNGIQYKLISYKTYKISDYPYPRGELLIKNNNNNKWFETGDIIQLLKPDYINIIDRKYNIVKLSNGEWFNPEYIENILLVQCSIIEQIYLYAEKTINSPIALIYPNIKQLQYEYTKKYNYNILPNNWNINTNVISCIQDQILKCKDIRTCYIPSQIIIITNKFSINEGTLTSTMKLCRPKIQEIYNDIINKHIETIKSYNNIIIKQKEQNNNELNNILTNILNVNIDNSFTIDSINATRISQEYYDKVGIKINPSIITKSNITLNKLNNILKDLNKINETTNNLITYPPLEYIDIEYEEELLDILFKTYPININNISTILSQDIFLTGATGFLGGFVLNDLLQNTNKSCKIWCLIRDNSYIEAKKRLLKHLESIKCLDNIKKLDNWENRINIILGSLDKELFGLSKDDFINLHHKIDCIFHIGAKVSAIENYYSLRKTNVQSTLECIKLCIIDSKITKKICRMNYISSGAVFNAYKEGKQMNENHILEYNHSTMYMDGYSRTKWISDRLCLYARNKYNLPVIVFRPGFISCDSINGIGNINDFDNRLISGILQLKKYPNINNINIILDQSPVNWISECISKLGLHSQTNNLCFHFMNPNGSPKVIDILNILNMYYKTRTNDNLEKISYNKWIKEMKNNIYNPLYPLLQLFGNTFPNRSGLRCDMSITNKYLKQLNIPLSIPITNSILIKWIEWNYNKEE